MISFVNNIGLYTLLGLVALILLYLFARKPRKKVFSSLIFFVKDEKTKRKTSFFRTFLANILFFLQFLAILLLALSAATLLIDLPKSMTEQEHTINIIDSSASMQSPYKSSTRFETALDKAPTNKEHNSIILAQDPPSIVLEHGSSQKAKSILNQLIPSESKTNIADSLLQALTLPKGSVNVYSDFSNIKKSDILTARQKLLSEGYKVEFHTLNEPKSNVGILGVNPDSGEVKIKNYNDESANIQLRSQNETKETTIQKRGFEILNVPLEQGKNKIELKADDDFKVDNEAYISLPDKDKIKTLFISSKDKDPFLKTALDSIGKLDINYDSPPLSDVKGYDLYIIKSIDHRKVLPTTFEEIDKEIKNGASLILNLQSSSSSIDYKPLTKVESLVKNTTTTTKRIKNEVTSDINFGNINKHFTLDENCEKWVTTPQNHSIVCYTQEEKGEKLIFGILEDESDFKNRPDYPIFWKNVIYKLFNINKEEKMNYETGTFLPVKGEATTPLGKTQTNKIHLNKQGFYTLKNKTISANLFNYKESDINNKQEFKDLSTTQEDEKIEDAKNDITIYLIMAALILVITELIIIKWRGDI